MLDPREFLKVAQQQGFDFMVGVPCSFMTSLINAAMASTTMPYVAATSEGEAMAIAAGAWLAGRKTIVVMQNSGLGNAVNPLTSLNAPFQIPALLMMSWRGCPGIGDEPQHRQMGDILHRLLDLMEIAHAPLGTSSEHMAVALSTAAASMDTQSRAYALIVKQDDFIESPMTAKLPAERSRGHVRSLTSNGALPSRYRVLDTLLTLQNDAAVIVSTGKGGRELFTLDDRPQHFYQVGSMGCASAMALGLSLNTKRRVLVIDGDGAALMKLGNWATIGAYGGGNFIHLLLDNGMHDSTGGQPTVSPGVRFADAAIACGYTLALLCDDLEGVAQAYQMATDTSGPVLIHVRIAPGSHSPLGRPTISPAAVARRMRAFVNQEGAQ